MEGRLTALVEDTSPVDTRDPHRTCGAKLKPHGTHCTLRNFREEYRRYCSKGSFGRCIDTSNVDGVHVILDVVCGPNCL